MIESMAGLFVVEMENVMLVQEIHQGIKKISH